MVIDCICAVITFCYGVQELYNMKAGALHLPSHDTIEYLTQAVIRDPAHSPLLLSHLKSADTTELINSLVIDSLHRCASQVR